MKHDTVTAPSISSATSGKLFSVVKWAGIIAGLTIISNEIYHLYLYYTVKLPANQYSQLRIVGLHVQFFTDMAMPLMAVLIFFKSKNNTAFYLALFIIVYQASFRLPNDAGIAGFLLSAVVGSVAGILLVLSFQHFPKKITPQHIDAVIKYKWLRRYLKTFLHPRSLWIGFFALLLSLAVVDYLVPGLNGVISSFLIMLTAFAYLYINYRSTSGTENARILWLFWGLLMYILLFAVYSAIYMYRDGVHETATVLFAMAMFIILFFSFGMSLFFADAFDTGKFVTRTAVNGILFVLVIIIYNTLEHYVLHWLAHTLHISNVMLSSFLSGIIVLCISPLHHRLTHFLNRKLQNNHWTTHG